MKKRWCALAVLALTTSVATAAGTERAPPKERIEANDNRQPGGESRDGVLVMALEVREGRWFPESERGSGLPMLAFAERGKPARIPGPLIRVPEGTRVSATITNTLTTEPVRIHGFHTRSLGVKAMETLVVAPGETRQVELTLEKAGTYYYWGDVTQEPMDVRQGRDSQLNGAIIVDPKGGSPADRVFVLGRWETNRGSRDERRILVVNGKSWPHNEKLSHQVGDEVHWRWINPSARAHPMHLHGFYYRVDAVGDGVHETVYAPEDRRMVVTERVPIGGTASVTWHPRTAGRWILHCHVASHIAADSGVTPGQLDDDTGMKGMVIGITVSPPPNAIPVAPGPRVAARQLRLVVQERTKARAIAPAVVYQIQDGAQVPSPERASVPAAPIFLTRDEPAEITVVNRLRHSTAVHWHGIELESYFDGVPGWGGYGPQATPPIKPGQTFVARMTPPRAGTFIYHTHWHDPDQLLGGLYGPLIVLEPGQTWDPQRERIFFISTGGYDGVQSPLLLLNGQAHPRLDPLLAGVTYRVRLINLTADFANPVVSLLEGNTPVKWRMLAKDAADLPERLRTAQPARQLVTVGETYDFELQVDRPTELTLEIEDKKERVVAKLPVRAR